MLLLVRTDRPRERTTNLRNNNTGLVESSLIINLGLPKNNHTSNYFALITSSFWYHASCVCVVPLCLQLLPSVVRVVLPKHNRTRTHQRESVVFIVTSLMNAGPRSGALPPTELVGLESPDMPERADTAEMRAKLLRDPISSGAWVTWLGLSVSPRCGFDVGRLWTSSSFVPARLLSFERPL